MIARAAFLQVLPNSRLKALQKRQFETVVTLNPRRGDVLDRNGKELAVSMTSYSLFADPKLIEEPRQVSRMLARELSLPIKQVYEKMRDRKKRFIWVQRRIDGPAHDSILAMKIRGLGFIEESQRIYPNDRLLSQTLGFVGGEGQGLEGIELGYNDSLQAAQKKFSVRRDARGRPLIVNGQVFNQAPDGNDVQLTIDREMQFVLEQELSQAVRVNAADSAVGVVLDAQTSEVLAIGSAPSFDPNHVGDFSVETRRNRAVTDSFEPGSTMKTFVIAGAMSRGLVEPNTKFDCEGGSMRIGKRTIHEATVKETFKILTVSEILAKSSNVGIAKVAFKMGPDAVLQTLKNFGFGEKTGVDLPGEAHGIIQSLPWHEHLLANVAFGQGITATPLQIANAYAAIANGGWLKQPSIVKAIRDHESGDVTDTKTKAPQRVLNEEYIAKMRLMLRAVTSDLGTGSQIKVPGFPVAGKTGTAQKVDPHGRGYMKNGYVSSFAGFLPANDPRFVIYVAVDNPRKGHFGGEVAGPIFVNVAKFAVRHAGLSPVLITEQNRVPTEHLVRDADPAATDRKAIQDADMEMAQSMDQAQPARTTLIPLRMAVVSGASILPTATAKVNGPASGLSGGVEPIGSIVPDMAGLTLREVLSRVSGSGVNVHIRGQGFVTRTVPAFGARLSQTKDLEVYLSR